MLFWALLLFLSLASFDASDPSFNLVKSGGEVRNKAGLLGAYAAGFLNDIFGIGALLWPLVFADLGMAYISASWSIRWWRWCGFFLLTLCLLMAASSLDIYIGDLSGGGMVGNALYFNGKRFLSPAGSFILWLFIFLIGLQLACNISWINIFSSWLDWLKPRLRALFQRHAASETAPASPAPTGKNLSFQSLPWGNLLAGAKNVWARIGSPLPKKAPMPEIQLDSPVSENIVVKPQKPAPPSKRPTLDDDEPFAVSEDLRDPDLPPVEAETAQEIEPVHAPSMSKDEDAPEETPAEIPVESVFQPLKFENPSPQVSDTPLAASEPSPSSKPVNPAPALAEPCPLEGMEAPLPPLELLKTPAKGESVSGEDLKAKGQALMACFRDFDVHGELVRITPGPVVTMFEMRPAPGTRVSKIANLSDDLSLALKAVAVRIQAPIPGSDTVGIEIPNERRETVNFRELAASQEFTEGCGPLTMILGKDIAGRPFMADLARMPHLLVAGATGAGKSVCLNSILISLLYRSQPDEMRLLLVDPKRIEMAAYADLPHLVHPVVTEMADAKNALDWAVHEMENRYKAVARLGVRNVAAYNRKLAAFKDDLPPDFVDLEPLPYLVIVIDELADLMMTAAREVETSIVRLAQLARAAGIHMILATQRPSVDVVTGLIKANFPCRISFQVTSKHDSRTILDQVGAEHLLGRGDMLYKPSGGKLQRLHGPFLSDEEVAAVASHWKSYLKPSYKVDFSQWSADSGAGGASPSGDATADSLYADAKAFVMGQERASISLLQRHLKIGFNRAARLMEQFDREGLLGPQVGSSPRNVIR